MQLEVYQGCPTENAGRLAKEIRTYDFLDSLGVTYNRVDHPAAETMEACAPVDEALGTLLCKNLFLCNRQKTDYYLLMLPGNKVFKTKDLSKQIGSSRLSFGDGEAMEALLDITPGSLSVLGLINDPDNRVRLLIDEEVLQDAYLCCHPCINTSSLRLRMEDFQDKILPAMHHTPTVIHLVGEE